MYKKLYEYIQNNNNNNKCTQNDDIYTKEVQQLINSLTHYINKFNKTPNTDVPQNELEILFELFM